jgi:hypothetical protein
VVALRAGVVLRGDLGEIRLRLRVEDKRAGAATASFSGSSSRE